MITYHMLYTKRMQEKIHLFPKFLARQKPTGKKIEPCQIKLDYCFPCRKPRDDISQDFYQRRLLQWYEIGYRMWHSSWVCSWTGELSIPMNHQIKLHKTKNQITNMKYYHLGCVQYVGIEIEIEMGMKVIHSIWWKKGIKVLTRVGLVFHETEIFYFYSYF